jgi:Fe-S cluster assembly protein SufB
MSTTQQNIIIDGIEQYKYGFSVAEKNEFKAEKGHNRKIVEMISSMKKEPKWMLDFRLRAYDIFLKREMPGWGNQELLNAIDFDDIHYYIRPSGKQVSDWNDLPDDIKYTFDRLGVPESEKKFLAGTGAQFESEVMYHNLEKKLQELGVIFVDTDTAVQKYPDLVREYFGTVVPPADNKLAALNSAFWSGGSFIYIPKGVKVELPLQAYFRINAKNAGQFERTLIIADEGSEVVYIEGCSAPTYTTDSLHSAVVEIIVKKGAKVQYTTVQNWSKNIYNLVTKRARAEENALMEWVDCNIGSGVTMKYPAVYLAGRGARGEVLSIAYAGKGQHQDAGAKMVHLASDTTSRVISKSIAKDGGQTSYRGLVHIANGAKNAKASVICDALLLDDASRSDTYPTMRVHEESATLEHEATVERIGEDKLFYLTSRGIGKGDAEGLLVNGFIDPVVKEIPLEYSIELNRLINMEMKGSIG